MRVGASASRDCSGWLLEHFDDREAPDTSRVNTKMADVPCKGIAIVKRIVELFSHALVRNLRVLRHVNIEHVHHGVPEDQVGTPDCGSQMQAA